MPRVNDDLIWIPELEMALEFHGAWQIQVLPPPPMTALRAECLDDALSLEAYALDPDEFRRIDSVGRDLVHSRLTQITGELYQETPRGLEVSAQGLERGCPTELHATITLDNDAYYVLAFSADVESGGLERHQWRYEAMSATATFGRQGSYGTGLGGLMNLVGAQLHEPDVALGQSRAQLGYLRRPDTPRGAAAASVGPPPVPLDARAAPPQWGSDKVVVDPGLLEPVAEPRGAGRAPADPGFDGLDRSALESFDALLETPGASDETGLRSVMDRDELADFEARLLRDAPPPEPEPPRWPAPWEALPGLQSHLRARGTPPAPLAMTARASRQRRAEEIVAYAESLPAQVGFYAEKVFGVGEVFAHRDMEPFAVHGLERVPMALEAFLQVRQGELSMGEGLALGPPRKAMSRMGRQVADGQAVSVGDALAAMCREDDATAADLLGWRLGWRQIQTRMPAFGLFHHSILVPSRSWALAFTDLEGPLQGLDLESRIDLWRELDEDGRRHLIGELHHAHLETPLEAIHEAFVEMATDPSVSQALKARWSLALGPRGCAREYGGLFAALLRGEILGSPQNEQAQSLFKPCVGDQLSGYVPGVELGMGKLGQAVGSLNGAGVLLKLKGSEVAICVLAKMVETLDHGALVDELRVLAGRLYLHVMDM